MLVTFQEKDSVMAKRTVTSLSTPKKLDILEARLGEVPLVLTSETKVHKKFCNTLLSK